MERCNISHVKYGNLKKLDFSFDFNQSVFFKKKILFVIFVKNFDVTKLLFNDKSNFYL